MKVREVDPRDITWELDDPVFRVYFWKMYARAPEPATPDAWECMEYEVSEADVKEVIRWADEYTDREGSDRYTFYLRVDDADGPGMVRLFGADPTEPR